MAGIVHWEQIARTRIANILRDHTVAGMRTLEQKIADAGPGHQRANPHILTRVRNVMRTEGVLQRIGTQQPWYALANEDPARVRARLAVLQPLQAKLSQKPLTTRIGQALEIAAYKALLKSPLEFFGAYTDLHAHDDSTLFKKEEPPSTLSGRSIGSENLDFIARGERVYCGIEIKNIREWIYPFRDEVLDTIRKCLVLDIVPVLIARRIPYVTFRLLSPLGVIVHQQYNQLFPSADKSLADHIRDKSLLGYHDVRTGNEPDARLLKFFGVNLPSILDDARARFSAGRDLLEPFATGQMSYAEFAARVRRREQGTNEDSDWPQEPELDPDPSDFH